MVCNSCCKQEEKKKYKRGLWSPEEDNILESYILKYGHGYWSQVPKLAGLQRCGKSCRLRWINYLRPGLKRGSFSVQEQMTIINAHEIIGNRWSQIASMLPGRTDNEIKNLWHTHLKKKLKMNITNSDANARKTFGEEPLVCSSTSPTNIEANDLQMGFPYSKDELDFQSSRSRLPVSLPMPLSTECSMMQSNISFENGKPNPGVSKCLPNDNSLLGDLFCQWFTSGQKENPIISMASKTSEISQEYPQSISDSENTSCMSYESELFAMSEKYPLSREEQQYITSSEFTRPGLQDPSAHLPPFDNSLPFHENILCNNHSTTMENIAEYWDIMNYNEIDMGIPCDSSFIDKCYLLDSDFS